MKKTRILAFALTVVMIFSALSVTAFAAYTPNVPSAVKTEVDNLGGDAKFIASADFTSGTAVFVGGADSSVAKLNQYTTTYPNMYYVTDPVTGVKSLLLNKYPGTKNSKGEGGYRFIDGTFANYDPTPADTTNNDVIKNPDEGNNAFSLRTSGESNTRINVETDTVVVSTTMRFADFDNSFALICPTFYEWNGTNMKNQQRTVLRVNSDGALNWAGSDEDVALMQLTTDRAYSFTVVMKTKQDNGIYDLYCDIYVDGVKVGTDLAFTNVVKKDNELPRLVYCFMCKMSGAVNVTKCNCTNEQKTAVDPATIAGYTEADLGDNVIYTCEHDKQIGYVQSAYMYTLKSTYAATADYESTFAYNNGNTVNGYDLTINNGVLGLNYYLNLTGNVLADEGAKVRFTTPRGEVQETLIKNVTAETNGSYKFTATVSSVEMASNIKMEIVSGESVYNIYKNGTASEAYEYSVKEYAEKLLTDANYGNIAKAMLNYGAAAQTYFGFDTANLANANCAYTTELNAVTTTGSAVTITGTAPAGTKAALILDSDTSIVIYNAQGEKIGEKTGINSKNLDTPYEITCEGGTVTVSVLAIGEKVLASGTARADYKTLIKALKLFSDASKAL